MPIPRTVFLDTQVFEQEMFDFDSHHFSRLLKLVNQGLANVVITEITREEILSHIREHTTEALKSLKQAVKERPVGILRHLSPSFAELFKKHDVDQLVAEMESQFATFCKDANVNVLPSIGVDVTRIINDFFSIKPPFQEGRKKYEFPDALAFEVLRNWTSLRNGTLFVVSGDADWERMCQSSQWANYHKQFSAFFALFPDPTLAHDIERGIRLMEPAFAESAATNLIDDNYILKAIDGNIMDLQRLDISLGDVVIIGAEEGHAVAEIQLVVSLKAEVRYCDSEGFSRSWFRDPESLTDEEVVKRSNTHTLEIDFAYDIENPASIHSLGVPAQEGVYVRTEERDDEIPW